MAKDFKSLTELETELSKSGVVLLDCYTTWCGPCKMMAPVIEELSKDFEGKALISKVDVEKIAGAGTKFRVSAVPTILIFKDGKEVAREVGYKQKADLAKKINQFI